jgi:hypothetical protein
MTKKISLLSITLGFVSLLILLPIILIDNMKPSLNQNNLLSINSKDISKIEKILTKDLATALINNKLEVGG